MSEDRLISRASPVDVLPLIGEARSASLATIGIYSVDDFMSHTVTAADVVQVSRVTGLSASEIDRIRTAVPAPRRRFLRIHMGRAVAAVGVAIGISLIALGLVIELDSFYVSVLPSAHVIVLRSDVDGTLAHATCTMISTVESIESMRTRVVVRSHSAGGAPIGSIPKAVIVQGLRRDTRLMSVVSHVTFIETATTPAEQPGWVRQTEVRRHVSAASVHLRTLPENETIPARSVMAKLIPPPPPAGFRISEMNTETELTFDDQLSTHWLDRFRDGIVAVYISASAQEARPGKGFIPRTFGKVVLPVKIFDMGPREPIRSECIWRTALKGGFEAPDSMVGAKQFWSPDSVVNESFHYRVRGAKWLTYLAQIIGWPLLGLIAFVVRKH